MEVDGPAMMALTEQQRLFVLAMASNPFGSASEWARDAGYSDHLGADRVQAHRLLNNEKIERAAREVARRHMDTLGPMLATYGLLKIAGNPKHRDHLKALIAVADRTGFHATTQHHVAVQHTDLRGDALLARLKSVARVLGVDVAKLLGENVVPRETDHEKLIEGKIINEQEV